MRVGLAFAPGRLAACLAGRRGRRVEVARAATASMPPGALVPGLAVPNVRDEGAAEAALAGLFAAGRVGPAVAAVAIPDPAVRIRVLPTEPRGGTRAERARLVAWQLAATLPFAPAEARADYLPLGDGSILAVAASGAVVSQYEDLVRRRRLVPAQVGPASLALWHLLEAAGGAQGDRCLLLAGPGHATLFAVAGGRPRFWRGLADGGAGPASLAREVGDTVQALIEEGLLPDGPAGRVELADEADPALEAALRDELGDALVPLDPPAGLPTDPGVLAAAGAALAAEEALGWR